MRVILVYDIAIDEPTDQNRLQKIRKIARKYLHHIQKSVFEGDLPESKLEKMKAEIKDVIDKKRDMVLIYVFDKSFPYRRQSLTDLPPHDSNIL
jgi:CRISPR-associated protein Cas2